MGGAFRYRQRAQHVCVALASDQIANRDERGRAYARSPLDVGQALGQVAQVGARPAQALGQIGSR